MVSVKIISDLPWPVYLIMLLQYIHYVLNLCTTHVCYIFVGIIYLIVPHIKTWCIELYLQQFYLYYIVDINILTSLKWNQWEVSCGHATTGEAPTHILHVWDTPSCTHLFRSLEELLRLLNVWAWLCIPPSDNMSNYV